MRSWQPPANHHLRGNGSRISPILLNRAHAKVLAKSRPKAALLSRLLTARRGDSPKLCSCCRRANDPGTLASESRSLAGVLRALIAEHAARIASTNGPCAGFLHNKLAPALREGSTVIYLGDADFSGGHIEANTRDVLKWGA